MTPDVVGIGTSPLVLLRAVRLAEAGRRVLLADRRAEVGGGWAAPALLGFERVEVGAHLLENRPALLHAIETDVGVPLQADPCVSLLSGWRLPMGLARPAFHAATALRALARGEVDKARRGAVSAWRTALGAGRGYRYPREGAFGLLDTLRDRFAAAGGIVRHGLDVRAIRAGADGVVCETGDGDLRPDLALISSRAWAPVTIEGQVEPLDIEDGMCWNAVLHLRDAGGGAFSYVEILGDPLLKRVRDIGAFARPQPVAGERLVVVQYRDGQGQDDRALSDLLVQRLVRLGLLDRPGRLVALARTDFPLATLTDATLDRIARRGGGRIEVLKTSDLAEGFVSARSRLVRPAA